MNKSYSKIRHIQESNQRLERRLLNEQLTGDTTTPTTTPTVNLPTCDSKMVNDGRPGSSSEMTGSYTKITFNGTISPESQGYTVHTANGPFCFVPTGNKNYNTPPVPRPQPGPPVPRPQPGPPVPRPLD
jgi:hypothetical protein